jgi:hypothetical protein
MLGRMMAAPMVEIQLCEGCRCAPRLRQGVNSVVKPEFCRIFRFEQAADVARCTATGVHRVSGLSTRATGPQLAPPLDGSEQRVSVTSIRHYLRCSARVLRTLGSTSSGMCA